MQNKASSPLRQINERLSLSSCFTDKLPCDYDSALFSDKTVGVLLTLIDGKISYKLEEVSRLKQ